MTTTITPTNKNLARAITSGERHIHITAGHYVTPGLHIPSGTTITAEPNAHITFADHAGKTIHDHLLCNADQASGNADITIDGGIWDGNNPTNPRGPNEPGAHSGVPISFINVKNMTLKNMTITNPDAYYVRLGEVDGFTIENIIFKADHIRPNQDGIHMGGYCANGLIRHLKASGTGIPQDDMVALVADDIMELSPNIGLKRGPFKNITVEHLRADDCHSFVRLGSVFHSISDVTIRDVAGGCRVSAINADALRYCAGPVFDPDDPHFANGVGLLDNILIENFNIHKTTQTGLPCFMIESRLRNFTMQNLSLNHNLHQDQACDFIRMKHIHTDSLSLNGVIQTLKSNETFQFNESNLSSLQVAESLIETGILNSDEKGIQ